VFTLKFIKTRAAHDHSFVCTAWVVPLCFAVAGEQVRFRTRKLRPSRPFALEPGKQFTRDYSADLLWPEAPARHPRIIRWPGSSVIKAKIARDGGGDSARDGRTAAGWIDVDVTHCRRRRQHRWAFLDGFEILTRGRLKTWKAIRRA